MQNYTSKIYWKCKACNYSDDHVKFIYRYVEIPISSNNPNVIRRSSQHCPVCDSSNIDTLFKPETKLDVPPGS